MSAGPEDAGRMEKTLYFFPDREITETRLRQLLAGSATERAWVISHLLRYAQWEDIWVYVSREEVREILPTLDDLPDNLRQAWARMLKVDLKIEAPVGG